MLGSFVMVGLVILIGLWIMGIYNGLIRKRNAKDNNYSQILRSRHFCSLARSSRNCGMSAARVDSKAGGVSTANMGHCPAALYFRIMPVTAGFSGL